MTAITQDADGSTSSFTRNRNIRVRAVADEPGGVANDVSGDEDNPILLDLTAANSADTDGSETISVLLTNLPVGSLITGNTGAGSITQQGDDFLIEAPDLPEIGQRIMVAQDTGGAIKGEGRFDLFFGAGDLAGVTAGGTKHQITYRPLIPRRTEAN